jgi:uncharacterized protein (DUF433 family)
MDFAPAIPRAVLTRRELDRRINAKLNGVATQPALITIDPKVRFGEPCIRGHRITVQEILEWLSNGASQQQILADYPQLEPDGSRAVYA